MLDPDDNTIVSTVTNFYKHQLMTVDQDMKLDDMLEEFKASLSLWIIQAEPLKHVYFDYVDR